MTEAVASDTPDAEPLSKKSRTSLQRQKKLLALNKNDQTAYEKKVKKLRKKGSKAPKESAVLYVGHLAPEFREKELEGYFGQFGPIIRCRLSRSKKTGNSKGYAFIEFEDSMEAKIAAKTMDKYLMHEKLLKCEIVPKERVHEDMWKGAGEKWKYGLMYRLQRQEYNKVRSEQSKKRMTNKRQEKDEKLKALLKSCGLDEYEVPGVTQPANKFPVLVDKPAKSEANETSANEECNSEEPKAKKARTVEEISETPDQTKPTLTKGKRTRKRPLPEAEPNEATKDE